MKSLKNVHIGKDTKVFVRLDLDVPIENGVIEDTFRLDISKETLSFLKDKQAKIIIGGHMGRPNGEFQNDLSTTQLKPYFDSFFDGYEYTLLENLRFDLGEESNSKEFSEKLATLADIYVNDSFATSHREHASMVGIPGIIPGYAGFRLEKEISILSDILKNPKHPFLAIIGGAKIETKKPVIDKMLTIADGVLIGGKIGLDWSEKVPENLFLPIDYAEDTKDIGSKTVKLFKEMILSAKTLVWAGPMGMFEDIEFATGTKAMVDSIIESKCFSVVGGGDTVAAIDTFSSKENFGFVSSGGGAMLEFLVKGTLPALEVLK